MGPVSLAPAIVFGFFALWGDPYCFFAPAVVCDVTRQQDFAKANTNLNRSPSSLLRWIKIPLTG
jgi:hypothetical protein